MLINGLQVFNYLVGSLSRIFTTLQEVDDKLILYGFVAGFVLNAILAAQMVYYWNSPPSKKAAPGHKLQESGKQAIGMSSGVSSGANFSGNSAPVASSPQGKSPSTRRRG